MKLYEEYLNFQAVFLRMNKRVLDTNGIWVWDGFCRPRGRRREAREVSWALMESEQGSLGALHFWGRHLKHAF